MSPRPELSPPDARLLTALQEGLALEARPFLELGRRLGLSEDEVLGRVRALADELKLIRQISPIYDTRRCGYDSALVAFELPDARLERAAEQVGALSGVSHSYQRSHAFNLWFTLAVPPGDPRGLEATVEALARDAGAERSAVLRAKRTFKIGVKLALDGEGEPPPAQAAPGGPAVEPRSEPLSELEQRVIAVTQGHLPLVARPFLAWAEALGLGEEALLDALRGLKERGVMRRFAAILFHRKAGFSSNGMAVWAVEPEAVEAAGQAMAGVAAVSHCYERSTAPGWPYRLFSMIHGKSREQVEATVAELKARTGLSEVQVLYSTREFKKQRVELFPQARPRVADAR